jgi:Txe/YoeB family toxin of Txe-Axe toxin-antitoxin module
MGKKKREADATATAEATAAAESAAPADAERADPPEASAAAGPESPSLPPISSAPLPLVDLPAPDLGAFFELCFPDKRLIELCHELKLHTPGYRLEALPPDQVGRVLADEYREAKDARPHLETAVREALRDPVLEGREVSAADLSQLIDLVVAGDPLQHLARVAWRALLSSDEAERRMALEAIDEGIRALDAPAKQKKPPRKAPPPGQKEAEEAVKRAERAEREREAMKQQLSQARAEISSREQRLADQKAELTQARGEVGRLSAEVARLSAAGEGRALADARRYADEARALSEKLHASEEALEQAEQRIEELERRAQQAPVPRTPRPAEEAELPTEEEASSFLVPVLTREFYDSIQRWDRRMQRAAFDKIHRLANDWRHGSLRALPLEGVPGYYRIRVATDVRLIYRRDGNRLEILSLIDREDLDRYIRQARTRPA